MLDPVVKHHADPEQTMATFLLQRGASTTLRNVARLTPGEGISAIPAVHSVPERHFSGAALLTRPLDDFAEAIARANHEQAAATALLARGKPVVVRNQSLRRGQSPSGVRSQTPNKTAPGSSLSNARLEARAEVGWGSMRR